MFAALTSRSNDSRPFYQGTTQASRTSSQSAILEKTESQLAVKSPLHSARNCCASIHVLSVPSVCVCACLCVCVCVTTRVEKTIDGNEADNGVNDVSRLIIMPPPCPSSNFILQVLTAAEDLEDHISMLPTCLVITGPTLYISSSRKRGNSFITRV